MSYAERKDIYTEKIHHVNCKKCTAQANTNDGSHEIDKIDAVHAFRVMGWDYRKGTGWLCPECKGGAI